jgi:hypothetical protein
MVVGSLNDSLAPPLQVPVPPPPPLAITEDAGGKGAMFTTDGVIEAVGPALVMALALAMVLVEAVAFRGIPSLSSLAIFILRLSSCFRTPLENLSKTFTPSMDFCNDRRLPS